MDPDVAGGFFRNFWKKGNHKKMFALIVVCLSYVLFFLSILLFKLVDSAMADPGPDPNPSFEGVTTAALIAEIVSRGDINDAVVQIDTDELAEILKDRGVKLLIDARPDNLEQEYRRLTHPYRPSIQTFYYDDKVEGIPHVTDDPIFPRVDDDVGWSTDTAIVVD